MSASVDPNPLLSRLTEWTARHRWAVDASIAIAIVAINSFRAPDDAEDLAAWLCTVALVVPLVMRRSQPVVVFLFIAAEALVFWAYDVQAFGYSALLIALYTVAATQTLATTLAMASVLEVGIVLASYKWAPHHHPIDALVALSGMAVAAGVLGINSGHRRVLLDSLHERAARLEAERDQQGQLAAAAERARIAREMHDIVAHNVSVMIALADGATYAMHDDPEKAELAMVKSSRTGREALSEMRRLLGVLRDDEDAGDRTPQPGIGQIDMVVEQVRAAGMPTTLRVAGAPPEFVSGGLQLAAYRIVQEGLTNALKHGGAGVSAAVELRWIDDHLRLEIRNSGQIVTRLDPSGGGGGLRGMRERAAVYDGVVEAGPVPTGGWEVSAQLVQPTAALSTVETHA